MSSKSLVVWGVSRIRGGGTSVPRHDYYRRSVAGRDASLSASRPQEPRTLERDDRRGFCRFGDVIDRAGRLAYFDLGVQRIERPSGNGVIARLMVIE